MDVQSVPLVANERTRFVLPGRFFMLVESGGPLDVSFERNNSPTGEVGRNVEAGFVAHPGDWSAPDDGRFDAVVLESPTNQTVRIGISFHAADYRRVVGVVQVEGANDGDTVADVTAGAVSSVASAQNSNRRRVHIQNVGAANNARVAPGVVAANRGVQLVPGQSVTFETTAAINCIREAGADATLSVTEETRT